MYTTYRWRRRAIEPHPVRVLIRSVFAAIPVPVVELRLIAKEAQLRPDMDGTGRILMERRHRCARGRGGAEDEAGKGPVEGDLRQSHVGTDVRRSVGKRENGVGSRS